MPNLKEVRIRIESVKSTQQITSAMKMVSASKLRKAQQSIMALRPYANKMNSILQNLRESLGDSIDNPFINSRPVKKILIVGLASNRGLCGAFNSNVIKAIRTLLNEQYSAEFNSGQVSLLLAGKQLTDYYTRRKYPVIARKDDLFEKMSYEKIAEFSKELMHLYKSGAYDKIILVYNQFKNAAVQSLVVEQFLPLALPASSEISQKRPDYIFEPSQLEILTEIIPLSLSLQVYKAFSDSYASEQGARMTAMHQATDNAKELLKQLSLMYNKARQTAITNEILEIVSGAEALKG